MDARTHIIDQDKGQTLSFVADGFNSDIISAIHSAFPQAVKQIQPVAKQFDKGTASATANYLWHWIRQNVNYKMDGQHLQLVKMPSRLLKDAQGDCKSMALFAAAALAANGYPVAFRYTSYDSDPTPTHVYCYTSENGRAIVCDPVYDQPLAEKKYIFKTDKKMKIATLGGLLNTDVSATRDKIIKLSNSSSPSDNRAALDLFAATVPANADVVCQPKGVGATNPVIQKVLTAAVNNAKAAADAYAKLPQILKNQYQSLAGPTFLIGRTAFALLLRTNVKGIATVLQAALNAGKSAELQKLLTLFGIDFNTFKSNVALGNTKKPLLNNLKIPGIGEAATTATVAQSAPILTAIAGILLAYSQVVKNQEEGKKPDVLPDGTVVTPEGDVISPPGFFDDFFTNPAKLIGAGVLTYFGGKALKLF